jgi:hypothetical protein
MDYPVARPDPAAVHAKYRSLHKYLKARYADAVVLTFGEIEDLMGVPLPEAARLQSAWWTQMDADGVPSPQSQAWIEAERTAMPNLLARSVRFERTSP